MKNELFEIQKSRFEKKHQNYIKKQNKLSLVITILIAILIVGSLFWDIIDLIYAISPYTIISLVIVLLSTVLFFVKRKAIGYKKFVTLLLSGLLLLNAVIMFIESRYYMGLYNRYNFNSTFDNSVYSLMHPLAHVNIVISIFAVLLLLISPLSKVNNFFTRLSLLLLSALFAGTLVGESLVVSFSRTSRMYSIISSDTILISAGLSDTIKVDNSEKSYSFKNFSSSNIRNVYLESPLFDFDSLSGSKTETHIYISENDSFIMNNNIDVTYVSLLDRLEEYNLILHLPKEEMTRCISCLYSSTNYANNGRTLQRIELIPDSEVDSVAFFDCTFLDLNYHNSLVHPIYYKGSYNVADLESKATPADGILHRFEYLRQSYPRRAYYEGIEISENINNGKLGKGKHIINFKYAPIYTISFSKIGAGVSYGFDYNTIEYSTHLGTTVSLPTECSLEGYHFSGWSNSIYNIDRTFSVPSNLGKDISLEPTFDKIYTVKYYDDSESLLNDDAFYYGHDISTPSSLNSPQKPGYTFLYWVDKITSERFYPNSTISSLIVNYDLNLEPYFSPNNYSITYDLNGGVGSGSQEVTFDSPFTLQTPTKYGYTFAGWLLDNESFTDIDHPTYDIVGNITLVASWTPNTYTITFDANGGSVTPETMNVTYNTNVQLPTPTKYGYTFKGWKSGPTTITNNSKWCIADDTTLVADWGQNQHTITYHFGVSDQVATDNVLFDGQYTLRTSLNVPQKTGYTFVGWEDASGDPVAFGTYTLTVDEDIDLYAVWEAKSYDVTFDNGLTTDKKTNFVTYDATVPTLPEPTKDGYTFAGWFTSDDKQIKAGDTWKIDSNTTLYAHWTANKYNITFDVDGTTTTQNNFVTYGETVPTLPEPTKDGYTFAGWYLSDYTPVDTSFVWEIAQNETLFAHFTPNTYVLTIKKDGSEILSKEVLFDGEYAFIDEIYGFVPTKFYLEGTDTEFTVGLTWTETQDTTIYYKEDEVDKTKANFLIDSNGGEITGDNSILITNGQQYELEVPTKTGYTFVGYTLDGKAFDTTGTIDDLVALCSGSSFTLVTQWVEAE